jgi:hypothetical protein
MDSPREAPAAAAGRGVEHEISWMRVEWMKRRSKREAGADHVPLE